MSEVEKVVNNLAEYFSKNPKVGKVKINSDFSIEKVAKKNFKYIESWERLKKIVGDDRFSRTLKGAGIKIEKNPSMTKKSIRKFFICLMSIQKKDVDGLTGSIDKRIQKLFPFKSFKEFKKIFLGNSLGYKDFFYDRTVTCGKGVKGIEEQVYLLARHHFQLLEKEGDETKRFIRDTEMLASRFADREYKEGGVVHLSDGYYYVDKRFIGGGAFVYILRGLEDESRVKIVCRGTAVRLFATGSILSGFNDVVVEVGSLGIKSIFEDLLKYLEDEGIDEIECITGRSLGGSFAQILTTFIKGLGEDIKINNLVTVGSPGVSKGINELYKKVLGNETKIYVIRNGAGNGEEGKKYYTDHVPLFGGRHIGDGDSKNTAVYYIKPGKSGIETYPEKIKIIPAIFKFCHSFVKPHMRQTTFLKEFSIRKIEGQKEVEKELNRGNTLEIIRVIVACILGVISFWIFNGVSLAVYYSNLQGKIEESKMAEVFV